MPALRTRAVVEVGMASVIYHEQFIREMMPRNQPLFRTTLLLQPGFVQTLRKHVTIEGHDKRQNVYLHMCTESLSVSLSFPLSLCLASLQPHRLLVNLIKLGSVEVTVTCAFGSNNDSFSLECPLAPPPSLPSSLSPLPILPPLLAWHRL